MFATAEMSRLTVAAPVVKMEEVLRMCASLSCVHIEEYGQFQDGIGVGRALSNEGANQGSFTTSNFQLSRDTRPDQETDKEADC